MQHDLPGATLEARCDCAGQHVRLLGTALTSQPWWRAALVRLRTPFTAWASAGCLLDLGRV